MVVEPGQCGGLPLSKDIRAAIEEVLKDKDLDKITLKELRRAVLSHMDIGGKWFKCSLEGSRRDEFQLLATEAINEMKASTSAAQAPKPDWLDIASLPCRRR